MKFFIRNLSAPAELGLITVIFFGLQILGAATAIASQLKAAAQRQVQIGNPVVLRTVVLELAALAATLWIGSIRGWTLATFGARISWKGAGAGVLLSGAVLLASSLFGFALNIFHLEQAGARIAGMTIPFALILSAVNPVFEETLESGYFIHSLQHLGMWPAVLASALFTSVLHAYLGIEGAVGVLLARTIFGLAYWRWRQLWPLIVAHSLFDLAALVNP